MIPDPRVPVRRVRRRVSTDLAADPFLRYVLVVAVVLCGFWLWHRAPAFATRDERDRLLDPLVAYARVIDDPSVESLRSGVAWGRAPFGATFYLFGVAVLPVVLVAALVGDLGAIAGLADPDPAFGYFAAWNETPAWIWTASLVAVRSCIVAFAVGSVYLTYRLGTVLRDRVTGRVASVMLLGSFGFLTLAHEGGEDVPALFFVLLSLLLLAEYVQAGARRDFYLASLAGGVAIAFKLTAAPIVLVAALALVLRTGTVRAPLARPRLFAGGAALGALAILLGFPTLLVGKPGPFVERFVGDATYRPFAFSGPDAPVWWWYLRGYASGLGLPLLVTVALALPAALWRITADRDRATALVAALLAGYIGLFSFWHDFRVHHLLPTFPLLVVLAAGPLRRFCGRWPSPARLLVAVLVVTGGAYAVVGTAGYATMPRDEATAWLDESADGGETIEIYREDFQDAAIPHGMAVRHEFYLEREADTCPRFVELTYRDRLALHDSPRYSNNPERADYVAALLAGEYNYTMVAAFGPQPSGAPERPTPGSVVDALWTGLVPQSDYHGDEQELAPNQYTAVFERTGSCSGRPSPPF